jgi:hypothetical protein
MRKSTLRLYLPFLALIAVQALLIAFLPSQGAKNGQQVAANARLGAGGVGALGGAASAATDTGPAGGTVATGPAGVASGVTGAVSNAVKPPPGLAAGDITHCAGNKQFRILANANPPCIATFAGNNGGVTSSGVTKDKIKVIFFSSKPNEAVDRILATQGLAVPAAENQAYNRTALKFIEKHYEMYGRKFDVEFITGTCETSPPTYDSCNAAAQALVQKHPFIVIWGTPLYGSVFDIWARAGIVSFGGWQFDDSLFNTRRPYRYDPWMNGTEVGNHLAEYYCKKMATGKADHSGLLIHRDIGQRGTVTRKLGIITPEIEANTLAAKRVIKAVQACGGQVTDSPYTYESNIETATQQTQTTVSKLVQDKVTTVACMCDPIAPAFLTKGMTGNSYFPEFLITGTQFLDADLVGRLYDQVQMKHAFGVSTIPQQVPLPDADPTRVWRDMGSPPEAAKDAQAKNPCESNGCGINWSYINLLGTAIQMAGPNLNPLTVEKGLQTMPPDGGWASVGKPDVGFWKLGANDYTWLSDTREVYWSGTAPSPVDSVNGQCPDPSKCGAYVGLNAGRRYALGQWAGGGISYIPVEPN